jgi:hypothetical protein
MSEKIYDIDFKKLVGWLLPFNMRETVLFAYLKILVSPFVGLHQSFIAYRKAKLYELKITGQVCYLQMLLNDRYDFVLRRIYIVDAIDQTAIYFFQDNELHDVPLYTDSENNAITLYTDGETGGQFSNDFVVMVPLAINFSLIEMHSLIVKFKLPSMHFVIQTF